MRAGSQKKNRERMIERADLERQVAVRVYDFRASG
jgi:hypothetical protein